jgi:predicted transcriptional regulator
MTDEKEPIGSISEEFALLERHILILKTVRDNQPIGIISLSEKTGIPKHKVRYSLKLLEKEGIIKATPDGAVVTESCDEFLKNISEYVKGLYSKVEELLSQI